MDFGNAALLIVGHGSTVNPDSSAPTLQHAEEIRRRKIFAQVECAFWKEEPSLRDALSVFPDPPEVYVVPNFISEGYFTQTVIPRELELDGRLTKRENGQLWKYCEPVGSHPMMTDLLLQRAAEIAPDVDLAQATLLVVAHGTDLNENSAVAAKREVEKIRSLGLFRDVLNVYMEQIPRVADWRSLTNSPNVIVVPFFISDGLHSYEDIPELLGLEKRADIFREPYKIDNRNLYYAPSLGTDPRIAGIILAQVEISGPEYSCSRAEVFSPDLPPAMKPATLKQLQELGCFVLANGCAKKGMGKIAEMIRAARDYRWVAIYKIVKEDFVIVAGTGQEPPAYPRFPVTQGLCGAALESRKAIVVGDVRKDVRYLPAFHTTRSEIIVPMVNEDKKVVGMLDADSDKLNAFDTEDRQFLERAAGLIAHCLS